MGPTQTGPLVVEAIFPELEEMADVALLVPDGPLVVERVTPQEEERVDSAPPGLELAQHPPEVPGAVPALPHFAPEATLGPAAVLDLPPMPLGSTMTSVNAPVVPSSPVEDQCEKILGAEVIGPTDLLIENVSNATLSCNVSGPIHSAEWMKDNQKLSSSDRITFSNDNRSVMISPVRRSDSGVYQCTIGNAISSNNATYTMIVNFGPDNVTINGPSEVEMGQTVKLICNTESTPKASYKWMFNGSLTKVNTTEYTTKNADFTHTGNYSCIASNHVTGFNASGSHGLVVKEKTVSGGGQSLSAGAIAGIVIGVLVGIAAVAGLIFYFMKISAHVSALPKAHCQTAAVVRDQLPKFSSSELLAAQQTDPCLGEVLLAVQQHKPTGSIQPMASQS
ncbi:carcinoembryonic antigen-related cell adhesion molecule 20-like [Neoarius graeffei]|uniref:carcinoembryonic antigen-related cell adhesion molecule 20-like n=1 Tax=Neoarius graeffei TaxID=443677 RepID=UPI00298C2FA3|nr:carcinoembryonic antigen-related cell adhesion molecule 20-like [Neoarius graeffei]